MHVGAHTVPRHRFDAPLGSPAYRVWYGSVSCLGPFLEVFGDNEHFVSPAVRAGKVLGAVDITGSLRLLDLEAPAAKAVWPGLDDRIGTCDDYRLSQAWSGAVYRCSPAIDGFVYRGRNAGRRGPNVVLYLDRCADALRPELHLSVDAPQLDALRTEFVDLTHLAWP